MIKEKSALKERLSQAFQELVPIPLTEKLFFTQNLSIMLKAGMPLAKALRTLVVQTSNRHFKSVLHAIQKNIEEGKTFGESVRQYPTVFSEFFVNMVTSGEVSGKLEEILVELNHHLKQEHNLVSKVRGALAYPIFVILVMVVIGIVMMVMVVPQLVTIFEEVKAELPLATRMLIATSTAMVQYGLWLALGFVILVILAVRFFKTEGGKLLLSRSALVLPIVGTIVRKINLARFARTMSALLKTDIPIHETFRITGNVLGNRLYRNFLHASLEDVKRGVPLQTVFEKAHSLFPPMIIQMIAVGEETGAIDEILEKLATFYEGEVNDTMENLPKLIEPLLIVLLGVGVAAMAVAIIMPMYSLTQNI